MRFEIDVDDETRREDATVPRYLLVGEQGLSGRARAVENRGFNWLLDSSQASTGYPLRAFLFIAD